MHERKRRGRQNAFYIILILLMTVSVVWWSEFLATDAEILSSIPGAARFSEE
jgi:hypothetical protein